MKKIISIFALVAVSYFSKAQCFVYKLSQVSVVSVVANSDTTIVTAHITTSIDSIPYAGKFQQVDYNVPLYFNSAWSAAKINDSIPVFYQRWINENYISE